VAATGIGVLSTEVVATLLALMRAVPPAVSATAKSTGQTDFFRFGFTGSFLPARRGQIRREC